MISIIVPHYCTKREYFDKCMQSLLKDHDAAIEVLVIDDGSTNEYLQHLKVYETDERVRIIQESHKGVSNARNVGIKEAKGEWLMFVDSDDYLEEDYAKELTQFIKEKSEADVLFFNGYGNKYGKSIKNQYFIEENKDYGNTIEDKCKVIGSGLSLGRTPEYFRCFYTLGSPCSKLIKTKFIRENNIEFNVDVKFAEDTLFSMNLLFCAKHIYYKDLYLYYYFINEESVTGKYRKALSDEMDVFFKETWRFIIDNRLKSLLEESYYIRAFLEAQRCIRQEFGHRKNPESNKFNKAREFIKKEPYRSGIYSEYSYMKRKECKMASCLLKKGMVREYILFYNFLTFVRKHK